MKKLVSLLFLLLLFLTVPSMSLAAEKFIPAPKAQESADAYVDLVSENSFEGWKGATLQKPIKLYDFDNNLTSYLFQVINALGDDQGYIIVSAIPEFPGVLESTREGSNPYKDVKNGKGIYVAPLSYYENVEDTNKTEGTTANLKVKDLNKQKIVEKKSLKNKGLLTKEGIGKYKDKISSASSEVTIAGISNYSYKLKPEVPDYLWYKGCAPTSGANIIKYWDNNGYNGLVQDTTTGSYLIEVLSRPYYMNTDSDGRTWTYDMEYGLTKYMNDRGYYPTIDEVATFSYHKSELDADRPTWIVTSNHPFYNTHAVTGVGYEEFYDTTNSTWSRHLIVHDTWNTTPREAWVAWSGYFSHVFSVRM